MTGAVDRSGPVAAAPLAPEGPARATRPGASTWLITFTDLAALMLALFVMLFSMSTMDEAKWRRVAAALSPDGDRRSEDAAPAASAARNIAAAETAPGRDLDYLAALLTRQMEAEPRLAEAILRRGGDRIVISLPEGLLFAPDSATPHARSAAPLFTLAGLLRNLPNRIEVEGHTDPDPPNAARYASNWDLSLRRALAVRSALERAGYSRPVVARGYGASRFEALSPRLDPRRRYALARRVDIVIHEAGNSRS
jgi:chemotaxis protein MotB